MRPLQKVAKANSSASLLRAGRRCLREQRPEDARSCFAAVCEQFPRADEAATAQLEMARLSFVSGDTESARLFVKHVIARAKGGVLLEALFEYSRIEMRRENRRHATQLLRRVLVLAPGTVAELAALSGLELLYSKGRNKALVNKCLKRQLLVARSLAEHGDSRDKLEASYAYIHAASQLGMGHEALQCVLMAIPIARLSRNHFMVKILDAKLRELKCGIKISAQTP